MVIGSGISSASIVHTLLFSKPNLDIVVLEARPLCTGATGRNGGHCKAQSPGDWWPRKQTYGTDEAIEVMEYELNHLDAVLKAAKKFETDCDLNVVEGLDAYHDMKTWQSARSAVEDMTPTKAEPGARYSLHTAREDLHSRNVGDRVIGAIVMRGGSIWP